MSFFAWFQAQAGDRSSRMSFAGNQCHLRKRDRSLRVERLEERTVLACAAAPCWLQVTLTATDVSGNPITSVEPGEEFMLQATVSDLRVHPDGFEDWYPSTAPVGTFASYNDVTYDPSLVAVDGGVSYGALFTNGQTQADVVFATPGELDEVGAFADFSTFFTGTPSPALLFSVPFEATAAGEVNFALDPADILPDHESLLFGLSGGVPLDKIDFVDATIQVAAPSAQDQILLLTEQVNELVSSGVLNSGNGNALTSKLDNATKSLDKGNTNAGVNQVEAFIGQINALRNARKLTDAQADSLIDAANDVIASALV